jgi:1,4-alpha-glucan branching enzyme
VNFDEAVRSVVAGDHPDPFSFLGMHASEGGPVVRAFLPGAQAVEVVSPNGGSLGKLEHVHLGGSSPVPSRPGERRRPTGCALRGRGARWPR